MAHSATLLVCCLLCTSTLLAQASPLEEAHLISPGFYTHPKHSLFLAAAMRTGTDKVTGHRYDGLYSKYLDAMHGRHKVRKMLEIGLGCTMGYGPGVSAQLWRSYFGPQVEVWEAEFNKDCVDKHMDKLKAIDIRVVTGDQSDTSTLHRWINETGGQFDLIIDDGGHMSMQMYNAFIILFMHALKPGGLYVLEDLGIAHDAQWQDGNPKADWDMAETVKGYIESYIISGVNSGSQKPISHKPPPGIKTIDCVEGACAFIKCYADDDRGCSSYRADPALADYSMNGTSLLSGGRRLRGGTSRG